MNCEQVVANPTTESVPTARNPAGLPSGRATPVACTVIVVTYRSARHLPDLLQDLEEVTRAVPLRVVVIDNDSPDGSADLAEAAGALVVRAEENLGYAGAVNAAAPYVASARPVLVLNPDIRLQAEAVRALLAALDDGCGIAVPTLLGTDGSRYPSQRNEPSVLRALVDACLGKRAAFLPDEWSEVVWSEQAYITPCRCEWATGAVVMISAECLAAVGSWDADRFFLYSEETDFFRRARTVGFHALFVPEARVHHHGGGSGSSDALSALMAVNRVRYFEKYHGRLSAAVFRGAAVLHTVIRLRDRGQRTAFHALLRRSRWIQLPGGRPTR